MTRVIADPPRIDLVGNRTSWQLLIQGETSDGQVFDLTRAAKYQMADGSAARVSTSGHVTGLADGATLIHVTVNGQRTDVPVTVRGTKQPQSLNFERDIVPILSKFGCNSSGCHGKAEGQNGFKLSVFGFDPVVDYQAIVMQGRGRRVFPASPNLSLLLRKVSGIIPHGGGVRIETSRPEFETLREWISSGVPLGTKDDPTVTAIEVTPSYRTLTMGATQQLRVTATFSDGRVADVTRLAAYQTNNKALATVDESGTIRLGQLPGTAAVMATYMGRVAVFQALIPRAEPLPANTGLAERNFIDIHLNRRLRELRIAPSAECSDADFLRRTYLDIIGTLPSADETRAFLASSDPNRRTLLVDDLLKRPEYADYWSLKWSDLLRVNRRKLGHKQAYLYYKWIHDSFSANKPMSQFAKELLTAEGPLNDSPAGHFYRAVDKQNAMASTLSQVFLGVRIECAQCHHHPFDRWSQTDYYGMEAFFAQVAFKESPRGTALIASANRKTKHPRTGAEVLAHALETKAPSESLLGDRRRHFAMWLTGKDNPWFSRNIVNRVWAHFMGRGLVEPVDDFRLTNPPSNPELLDALAKDFTASGYDLHQLIRTITASAAYQRSTQVNPTNERDEQNYSRFLLKPLEAEVLFDAICQTTGVSEKFDGIPAGSRAIQLWDSEVKHYFLRLFGRPLRESACECERASEPTVSQVLHVLNSPAIQSKLSHADGNVVRFVSAYQNDGELVEQLYLQFFSRYPTSEERQATVAHLRRSIDRRTTAEDIAWSMLNSIEFLFNH